MAKAASASGGGTAAAMAWRGVAQSAYGNFYAGARSPGSPRAAAENRDGRNQRIGNRHPMKDD